MVWVTIDTGASSATVGGTWFRFSGMEAFKTRCDALAAYSWLVTLLGMEFFNFNLWDCKYNESIKVMDYLSSTIPRRQRFRKKYEFNLNL